MRFNQLVSRFVKRLLISVDTTKMESLITGHTTEKIPFGRRTARPELPVGTMILDEYEVISEIGRGSSGIVYKCKSYRLDGQLVALKIINQTGLQDAVTRSHLQRAVLRAHMVDHKNVVRLLDCVWADHVMIIVNQFIDGRTLKNLMSEYPSSFEQRAKWIYESASGLAAIHSSGIIHRDLKPSNIFIDQEGNAKLADFGIIPFLNNDIKKYDPGRTTQTSELLFHARAFQTEQGPIIGTPFYLSPEYLENSEVSEAMDIYSLGVIAYQVLTGQQPFASDNLYELIQAKLFNDPVEPKLICRECNETLSKIILRAMHRDPKFRIPDALKFSKLLAPYAGQGNSFSTAISNAISFGSKGFRRASNIPRSVSGIFRLITQKLR